MRTRALGAFVALTFTLLAVVAYYRLGWTQMQEACPPKANSSMTYSWSWQPPGFTCTAADGTVRRELWF